MAGAYKHAPACGRIDTSNQEPSTIRDIDGTCLHSILGITRRTSNLTMSVAASTSGTTKNAKQGIRCWAWPALWRSATMAMILISLNSPRSFSMPNSCWAGWVSRRHLTTVCAPHPSRCIRRNASDSYGHVLEMSVLLQHRGSSGAVGQTQAPTESEPTTGLTTPKAPLPITMDLSMSNVGLVHTETTSASHSTGAGMHLAWACHVRVAR